MVSPVYFRWTGAVLARQSDDGTEQGAPLRMVRQMDAVAGVWSGVSGPPLTDGSTDARFRGLAYEGTATTPSSSLYPRKPDGTAVNSVAEGETLYSAPFGDKSSAHTGKFTVHGHALAPGVEVVCSDLDFELLEVQISGKISGTVRTGLPSGV